MGRGGGFGVEDVVVVVAFLSLCVAASQALSIILHALFLLRFSLIIFCRPPKGEGGVWGLGAGRGGRGGVPTCTWKGVCFRPKPSITKSNKSSQQSSSFTAAAFGFMFFFPHVFVGAFLLPYN